MPPVDWQYDYVLRMVAAIIAGGLVGLERELSVKPAGFRTHMLVCLGAALFTIMSEVISSGTNEDSGRIAAQIVTGIGFLGAGAILHNRGLVTGLTTAAGIWMVASLGMTFGAGHLMLGAEATVLTLIVLVLLNKTEHLLSRIRTGTHFEVQLRQDHTHLPETVLSTLTQANLRIIHQTTGKKDGKLVLTVEVRGTSKNIQNLQQTLALMDEVDTCRRYSTPL